MKLNGTSILTLHVRWSCRWERILWRMESDTIFRPNSQIFRRQLAFGLLLELGRQVVFVRGALVGESNGRNGSAHRRFRRGSSGESAERSPLKDGTLPLLLAGLLCVLLPRLTSETR